MLLKCPLALEVWDSWFWGPERDCSSQQLQSGFNCLSQVGAEAIEEAQDSTEKD